MKPNKLSWLILIALSVVWGSSFILMKRGLEAFSSDEVAALRIGMAFIFLAPFLVKHYKIDLKKYWFGLLLMGVFGNLIPAFLFTKAETEISSSLTGMLNALTPMFTIIIGIFWLKLRPGGVQISGIIVGFIGAVALMYFDLNNAPSKSAMYGLLVVAATLCYAISVTGIRKYLTDLNSVTATVWAFSFTGPVALVYLFGFTKFIPHLKTAPIALSSLGYICILGIAGSALSVIAFNVLVKQAGSVFASTCTYLIPVVAICWGLMDYEKINPIQVMSMVVIIFSVYLINRR
ncbi:MAG: DMT family transporter [Bacteroidetes bacterium]|nr:DMT family transporter [Bacteroidota bacterium]